MKKILIISTEYPPATRSSGVQRIVNFADYLPEFGWEVSVLTMHSMAYGNELKQVEEQYKGRLVKRALAFNTAIHFSIKGRYLSWMALPDRWSSWVVFGFFSGLKMIKKNRPAVILSSYPHASAHLLAFLLHKATGIPYVADFRDPMLYLNSSVKGTKKAFYQWIEKHVVKSCRYAIFTTSSAINYYIKIKYPEIPDNKWKLIENGFDEISFTKAEEIYKKYNKTNVNNKIKLLHSGGIFPHERNPTCFLQAVSLLVKDGVISADNFEITFRAPVNIKFCQLLIEKMNLQSIVFIRPKLDYIEALTEMLTVDGLLIFQAANCNFQIPAKLYEYFRAKKPILALTDFKGETAKLLQKAGLDNIVPLDDTEKIAEQLRLFIKQIKLDDAKYATGNFIRQQSRFFRTQALASLLNNC